MEFKNEIKPGTQRWSWFCLNLHLYRRGEFSLPPGQVCLESMGKWPSFFPYLTPKLAPLPRNHMDSSYIT